MSDRALLFLVSLAVLLGALAAAVWLIATHQVGTFDGNFLLLSAVVVALAFGLYLRSMIRIAIKTATPPEAPKPAPAVQPEKKPAVQETVGKI